MKLIKRRKTLFVFLGLLIVSLVSLGVSSNSFRVQPEQWGFTFFSSVQQVVHGIGKFFSDTVASIRELGRLQEEYAAVVEQLQEYELRSVEVADLEAENARLRDLLGLAEDLGVPAQAAQIIGKDPANFHSTITINKGRAHGLVGDEAVVAVQDGTQGLVGRVVQVGAASAIVMPIYDASAFAAARIRRSRHEGLVQGGGRQNRELSMQYVDNSARDLIAAGDMVVTSGLSSVYPPNISIGWITSISARSYETTLDISLAPVVDFTRLELVLVLVESADQTAVGIP